MPLRNGKARKAVSLHSVKHQRRFFQEADPYFDELPARLLKFEVGVYSFRIGGVRFDVADSGLVVMFRLTSVCLVLLQISCVTLLIGQESSPTATSLGVPEFPVTLQQNIVAGKTGVGTKIEAKLTIATLVDGKVIPRNAVLSGEVTESAAKTSSEPSRLSLRMDSVQWKNGSAQVKIYLTAWYYPTVEQSGQDVQYGPAQPANRTWNGEGQYPDPNSKIYRPFPGDDSGRNSSPSNTPVSVTSNHRILMKDVESRAGDDGTITLLSHRSNLKFDKYTTYVFAAHDVAPAPTK